MDVHMIENRMPVDLAFQNQVATLPLSGLVDMFLSNDHPKLWLPPIQRSVVWRNSQIINYWDSLFRGYPSGTVMVHRAGSVGRDSEGRTGDVHPEDYLLFDGQQRLATVLLGFGKGPLTRERRIWVDLGKEQTGELRFHLRINSTGQPFGYRENEPNQKLELRVRRDAYVNWKGEKADETPQAIFAGIPDAFPWPHFADSACAVPLDHVTALLVEGGCEDAVKKLCGYDNAKPDVVSTLIEALEAALSSTVILTQVDPSIVSKSDEYARLFARIGQGGTSLTNDELTYSLIKYKFPFVHDTMGAITERVGRFASEVDLVLGAFRISKALAPWVEAKDWEKAGRPIPQQIDNLNSSNAAATKDHFLFLIPAQQTSDVSGQLFSAVKKLKEALIYDAQRNPSGLPPMLMARLSRELLDVLLLLAVHEKDVDWSARKENIIAFTLYWLLFVENHEKAALHVFSVAANTKPGGVSTESERLKALIADLTSKSLARQIPASWMWDEYRNRILGCGGLLTWEDRFKAFDEEGRSPGASLRLLSTHPELILQALTWLQRSYLAEKFSNYDPTSARDEDLPVDKDHLIPQHIFGLDLRSPFYPKDYRVSKNFRERRWVIGNSRGNFRLIDASENRRRKATKIDNEEHIEGGRYDFIDDLDAWNGLIRVSLKEDEESAWTEQDALLFQRLIDTRTLQLVQKIVDEGGISKLLPET